MKSVLCPFALVAFAAFVVQPAHAQSGNPPPKFAPLPPPPGLSDPGVKAVALPSQPASAGSALTASGDQAASSPATSPDVTVHKEGDAVYQEYRRGGRVYMVVVTQRNGVSYTYMVNDHGDLIGTNGAPPVRPVMYKILQWGGSKAPSAEKEDGGR